MKHISFLVGNGFSMLGLLSAVEPLRAANQFQPGSFSWDFITPDGKPVTASNKMKIYPESGNYSGVKPYAVFVCTGFNPEKSASPDILKWLKKQAADNINMGGIDTGSVILAKAGLLKGCRATVHWEHFESFREDFIQVDVTDSLYEIDKNRFTCSGGTASIDMMLSIISKLLGHELAIQISDQFMLEKIRFHDDPQRMDPGIRYKIKNSALIEAVKVMEENLEIPLSIQDVAKNAAVSLRHLSRLFKDELSTTPSSFYLSLRLEMARRLVLQTDMTMAEVSSACGFSSSGYFSKVYKSKFGLSPGQDK
jgi:AraC family carnitine catabolism transcriptional activator